MTRNYSYNIREGWIKIIEYIIRLKELTLIEIQFNAFNEEEFSKKSFTKSKNIF
jgi:hypothetical protein